MGLDGKEEIQQEFEIKYVFMYAVYTRKPR